MNAINSIREYVPDLKIDTPKNMMSKAAKIAIPVITLVGATLIDRASADRFTDCMDACDRNGRDAHELAKLLCYTLCWILAR